MPPILIIILIIIIRLHPRPFPDPQCRQAPPSPDCHPEWRRMPPHKSGILPDFYRLCLLY
jgi:hypothetical protein